MITAGIDIGAKTVKVVLLDNDRVLATSLMPSGLDATEAAEKAMNLAVKEVGIEKKSIQAFMATGTGRKDCPFTDNEVTEVSAAAKGARHLLPSCRTVIDVGAEEGRTMRIDDQGKIIDFAFNEKCAAGAGAFAESMARALQVPMEELGSFSLKAKEAVQMNAQCAVFAESEVVSLIHSKTPREEIARAVLDAIANRIISMVRKVGFEKEIMLVGGMALNRGYVEGMKRGLKMDIYVPKDPVHVGALGAALLAGV